MDCYINFEEQYSDGLALIKSLISWGIISQSVKKQLYNDWCTKSFNVCI